MKRIEQHQRRVANINNAEYTPWPNQDGSDSGTSVLQLKADEPLGVGFHVYRMEPGAVSQAHEHTQDEQFLVLDGELIDNDGTVYRKGDLVWLEAGTQHWSEAPNGCLLAVHIGKSETPID